MNGGRKQRKPGKALDKKQFQDDRRRSPQNQQVGPAAGGTSSKLERMSFGAMGRRADPSVGRKSLHLLSGTFLPALSRSAVEGHQSWAAASDSNLLLWHDAAGKPPAIARPPAQLLWRSNTLDARLPISASRVLHSCSTFWWFQSHGLLFPLYSEASLEVIRAWGGGGGVSEEACQVSRSPAGRENLPEAFVYPDSVPIY